LRKDGAENEKRRKADLSDLRGPEISRFSPPDDGGYDVSIPEDADTHTVEGSA